MPLDGTGRTHAISPASVRVAPQMDRDHEHAAVTAQRQGEDSGRRVCLLVGIGQRDRPAICAGVYPAGMEYQVAVHQVDRVAIGGHRHVIDLGAAPKGNRLLPCLSAVLPVRQHVSGTHRLGGDKDLVRAHADLVDERRRRMHRPDEAVFVEEKNVPVPRVGRDHEPPVAGRPQRVCADAAARGPAGVTLRSCVQHGRLNLAGAGQSPGNPGGKRPVAAGA